MNRNNSSGYSVVSSEKPQYYVSVVNSSKKKEEPSKIRMSLDAENFGELKESLKEKLFQEKLIENEEQ